MCHSFTFTMRPCFYRYTKIIKINYKKSQVFLLDNTVTPSSFLLLDIKQFIVHPLLFLDNSRRPSPRCLYVCVHKWRWQLNYMKVNVALVICVNRKALNTHIWRKNGLRSCKAHLWSLYAEKCVYAMHATNKHRQMLITQLFSHVGSQNKPYLKLSVVLIRVTKLFTETRTWLLENKLKI